MKTKKVISLAVLIFFIGTLSMLILQYSMLYGLKKQSNELSKKKDTIIQEVEQSKNKIEKYQNLLENKVLLENYAEHNGYYTTDEVYIIK